MVDQERSCEMSSFSWSGQIDKYILCRSVLRPSFSPLCEASSTIFAWLTTFDLGGH